MDRLTFDEALEELINKYIDLEYDKVDIADSLEEQMRKIDSEILDASEEG